MRSRQASIALVGFGVYGMLLVAVHFASPDYLPGVHFLSDYVHGPGGWILQLAFVVTAGSEVMLVRAVASTPLAPWGSVASRLLLAGAASRIILLVFPIDPMEAAFGRGFPPDLTPGGWIHMLTGMAASAVFSVAAVLVTRSVLKGRQAPMWGRVLIGSLIVWFVSYGLVLATPPLTWPVGWYQRVSMGMQWIWLVGLAALVRSTMSDRPLAADSAESAVPAR